MSKKISRREARTQAFSLVFEYKFHSADDLNEIYETAVEERELSDDEYTKELFFGVCNNIEKIDTVIEECSDSWKIARISKVSLAALRVSLYEMLFVEGVSHAVAINEAVEITKRYEGKDASSFVNGILGTAAKKYAELQGE